MRNAAKPGRFVTDGSTKFDRLIEQRGITTQAAADDLRASRATVHQWRKGQIRPSDTHRLRIAVWSKETDASTGEVVATIDPAADWLLPEERELVQQLTQQLGAA
jgi:transcriptional regulator with XRE-family HTH domain